MSLPGETISDGAAPRCDECGTVVAGGCIASD